MTVFLYIFFFVFVCINSLIAVYESLKPQTWLHFLVAFLSRPFHVKIYTLFLLLLFTLMTITLLTTRIMTHLTFFVWIIDLYILLSAVLFFFYFRFLKNSFNSMLEEFPERMQNKMVYLDSFLRLVASLIIAASMIP